MAAPFLGTKTLKKFEILPFIAHPPLSLFLGPLPIWEEKGEGEEGKGGRRGRGRRAALPLAKGLGAGGHVITFRGTIGHHKTKFTAHNIISRK